MFILRGIYVPDLWFLFSQRRASMPEMCQQIRWWSKSTPEKAFDMVICSGGVDNHRHDVPRQRCLQRICDFQRWHCCARICAVSFCSGTRHYGFSFRRICKTRSTWKSAIHLDCDYLECNSGCQFYYLRCDRVVKEMKVAFAGIYAGQWRLIMIRV